MEIDRSECDRSHREEVRDGNECIENIDANRNEKQE